METSDTLAAAIIFAAIIRNNADHDEFKVGNFDLDRLANTIHNLAIKLEGKRLAKRP